jgi:hypothetical protein
MLPARAALRWKDLDFIGLSQACSNIDRAQFKLLRRLTRSVFNLLVVEDSGSVSIRNEGQIRMETPVSPPALQAGEET